MKIEVDKRKDSIEVKTVDGVFRFAPLEKNEKSSSLEFDDSTALSIEQLIQNVFSITQDDHQLVLVVNNLEAE